MHKKPEPQSALNLGYSNMPPKLGEVTLAWASAMPSCNTEKSLIKSYAPRNYPHSPEQIAEEIRVDEEGRLWWKKHKKGRKFYDKPLGTISKQGYLVFGLNYNTYYNHVICFCLYHGRWPQSKLDIDHINRNKLDNRKENLRELTRNLNNLNSEVIPTHNTSGHKNIQYNKRVKQWAIVTCIGKQQDIIFFKTLDKAIAWNTRLNNLGANIKL